MHCLLQPQEESASVTVAIADAYLREGSEDHHVPCDRRYLKAHILNLLHHHLHHAPSVRVALNNPFQISDSCRNFK